MNLSEAVNRIVDLARKVRDYYAVELPKRYRDYPLVGIDDESVAPPPDEMALREFLGTLSDEMVYQLILIMYLGRGDLGTDDLAEYYQTLKDAFSDSEIAVSQMMHNKAPLADYLLDGLEELRTHKIDVDRMPLKKIKARKR